MAWGANLTRLAHELGVRVCAGTDMMGDPAVDSVPNIHRYGLYVCSLIPSKPSTIHIWWLFPGLSKHHPPRGRIEGGGLKG